MMMTLSIIFQRSTAISHVDSWRILYKLIQSMNEDFITTEPELFHGGHVSEFSL